VTRVCCSARVLARSMLSRLVSQAKIETLLILDSRVRPREWLQEAASLRLCCLASAHCLKPFFWPDFAWTHLGCSYMTAELRFLPALLQQTRVTMNFPAKSSKLVWEIPFCGCGAQRVTCKSLTANGFLLEYPLQISDDLRNQRRLGLAFQYHVSWILAAHAIQFWDLDYHV
jgi:hypothetical protein